jgi:anti-sigma-K factor RskA
MDCITKDERGTEILLDYCTGTLDSTKAVEVDRHVASCAGCRAMVEEQRAVFQAMDSWATPEISSNFDSRLYARISVERHSGWSGFFRNWWKPAIPVALAAAALSVLFVVRSSAPVSNHTRMEKADLEQVEQALDDMDMLAPAAM